MRNFPVSTGAARLNSPARTTRCMNAILCLTTSSIRRPPAHVSVLRPCPLRAGHPVAAMDQHREDVCARERQAHLLPLDGVSHWPLARQQCDQSLARSRSPSTRSTRRISIGSICSSRSPTPAWATAASGAWRRASSTRWRRCSSRRWATVCGTNTASSSRPSGTAGSRSSRTTGSVARTPGRLHARTRQVEIKLNCSFEVTRWELARDRWPAVQL